MIKGSSVSFDALIGKKGAKKISSGNALKLMKCAPAIFFFFALFNAATAFGAIGGCLPPLTTVPVFVDQAVLCSFEKKLDKGFRVHLFEPVNESGRCRRFFFCFASGCA